MTRQPCRFVRTIVCAIFLSPFGILLSLPGTAFAQGGEQGLCTGARSFLRGSGRSCPCRGRGSRGIDRAGSPPGGTRFSRTPRTVAVDVPRRARADPGAVSPVEGAAPGTAGADHGATPSMAGAPRGAAALPEGSTGADERRRAGRSRCRAQVLRPDALPSTGGAQRGKAKDLGVASSPDGGARGGDGLLALLPRSFRAGTRNPPVVPVRARPGSGTNVAGLPS